MKGVATGIDCALRDGLSLPGKGRVALLCNATTVTADWIPTAEALHKLPGLRLERILSPQHGFAAEKQDNMVESADGTHPRLGTPIISLYAERREPQAGILDGIDALLIDLPDVGTRVYTFLSTALLCIRSAAVCGVPTVILDRPNPIGGDVEGPVLEDEFRSFVGMLDLPLRHGLTAGEFCRYGAASPEIAGAADTVRVIPLEGWTRSMYCDETALPWTMPSPNVPTLETAVVYPGQVILEGTNLSEGRGTTRPFEFFGAPYLAPEKVLAALGQADCIEPDGSASSRTTHGASAGRAAARGRKGSPLWGTLLREVAFEPTFNKYAGELVRGFQMHVIDRSGFRPVEATTTLLWAIRRAHPEAFAWSEPPYEYEWKRLPVDLICGTDRLRVALDADTEPRQIIRAWADGLSAYRERVRPFLIYGER